MPGPAPVRLDSNLWRAHADTLRAGPAADPAAYRHSEASLTLGMTDAAGCLRSFVRSLGQAAFDDAVADAIHGTPNRTGLLEEFRQSAAPIEYPKTWFLACLRRRLLDVQRRLGRERAYIAQHLEPVYAAALTEGDPGALPAEVEQTFADVANFGAVLLAVSDGLPRGHAFAQLPTAVRKQWTSAISKWLDTAGHLRRDNGLGPQRLRWPGGINGNDNHARAWQVRYYASVGATDYFDSAELPQDKRSAEGALSYQHFGRFRKTYGECSALGSQVVEGLADTALPLRPPGQKRRALPLAWEPARHATLFAVAEDK